MLTVIAWILGGLAIAALLLAIAWLVHRLCIRLEDAGYLYYRKPSQGGAGGSVFYELDRLTRPSVEHVVEVQDEVKNQEESIGGE